MNINWNAKDYKENFSFVPQYGKELIELIDVRNGTVLDLGCGAGTLTNELKKRGFKVLGLDASNEFLETARKSYPEIEFILGDATDFALEKKVDVVFSNAVFHWIDKKRQSDMLECVYNALRPNGEFVFEMGGFGNNSIIHHSLEEVFSEFGYQYKMPFYFPTIGQYSKLLEDNGFQVTYALLFDRPTPLEGENGLKNWIDMFIKTPFEVVRDIKMREDIKNRAVGKMKESLYKDGRWYSDYVRLRMKAIRY